MTENEKLICPLMTAGWLSNPNSVKRDNFNGAVDSSTRDIENMVSCQKEDCPLWDKAYKTCNLGITRSK